MFIKTDVNLVCTSLELHRVLRFVASRLCVPRDVSLMSLRLLVPVAGPSLRSPANHLAHHRRAALRDLVFMRTYKRQLQFGAQGHIWCVCCARHTILVKRTNMRVPVFVGPEKRASLPFEPVGHTHMYLAH